MLDGMSDSIQGSRIENLQSREVDRQSHTGLIFIIIIIIIIITIIKNNYPLYYSVFRYKIKNYYTL